MAPTFLTLPWDVRHRIFASVDEGDLWSRIIERYDEFTVCCDRSITNAIPAKVTLSLRSVCHQIRDEVSDHLFTDNVFLFDEDWSLLKFNCHCPEIADRVRKLAIIFYYQDNHPVQSYEPLVVSYRARFHSVQAIYLFFVGTLNGVIYQRHEWLTKSMERNSPDHPTLRSFVSDYQSRWTRPRRDSNARWLKADEMELTSITNPGSADTKTRIHLWSWSPRLTESRLKQLRGNPHHWGEVSRRLNTVQSWLSKRENELLDRFFYDMA